MGEYTHSLPVKIDRKAYMAGAIVLGGALHGAEVDHLTKNNLHLSLIHI